MIGYICNIRQQFDTKKYLDNYFKNTSGRINVLHIFVLLMCNWLGCCFGVYSYFDIPDELGGLSRNALRVKALHSTWLQHLHSTF